MNDNDDDKSSAKNLDFQSNNKQQCMYVHYGTYPSNQNIHLAVSISPNFRASRFSMDFWIVGVIELLQKHSLASQFTDNFFRLGNGYVGKEDETFV